jgi:predicted ABC-type ATPase
MVAGPNGSGKTTLLETLLEILGNKFSLGYYLNPDAIEKTLAATGDINFNSWGLRVQEQALRLFIRKHQLHELVKGKKFSVRNNVLVVKGKFKPGYFVSILCDFMRRRWLATGQSFTFETVMSNHDKVKLLQEARAKGYRTYLYYICTNSPLINRERVAMRVLQGGHPVLANKIKKRYERSLSFLSEAIQHSCRAYLFDNSGKVHRLIAEYENAKLIMAARQLPQWIIEFALNKK